MAIKEDIRKTLNDPTPLYFAAGTADLAVQQARKVPALIEKFQAEAPARIDAVRQTDPKDVQEKAAARAKEAQETLQARFGEVVGGFDTDLRKLGETAQGLALRGVGVAAEYVIKARETYEKVAEHGEQTVRTWWGEDVNEASATSVVIEREPVAEPEPKTAEKARTTEKAAATAPAKKPAAKKTTAQKTTAQTGTAKAAAPKPATAKKTPAQKSDRSKAAPSKPAAKKSTPPSGK